MLHFHHFFLDILPLIQFLFFVCLFILKPYIDVQGQLVRPTLQVRRRVSSRTTQNMLSPDPSIPLNQVQPRGFDSEVRDEQDNDYITYVV